MMSFLRENNKKTDINEYKAYLMDERKVAKPRNEKVKTPKIKPKITEVIPISDITGNSYFELKDNNGFFEIVQISSKDIYTANESERDRDMADIAYLYRSYHHDLKIVPMNFPINVDTQKNYYRKLISKCTVKEYLPHLEEKLRELEHLEEYKTNREYYLFVYADTEYELKERVRYIDMTLSNSNPISNIDEDKKIRILNKLYNMNTKTYTQ